MFNEPHDLAHEFPEYKDKMHELKMRDAHFARLFDEYHEINKQVLRIEQEIDKVSDAIAEKFKKQRLTLKDQLFAMLKKAA